MVLDDEKKTKKETIVKDESQMTKEELYEKILNGDIINQFADFLKLKKCLTTIF